MTAYASRRDKNHSQIRDALRQGGCLVEDAADSGKRGYDLLTLRGGVVTFVEIKRPSERNNLTAVEIAKRLSVLSHGGRYVVVTSVEEALKAVNAR